MLTQEYDLSCSEPFPYMVSGKGRVRALETKFALSVLNKLNCCGNLDEVCKYMEEGLQRACGEMVIIHLFCLVKSPKLL